MKRADKRLAKAFTTANKKVSEEVVSKGRPAIQGLSSPGGSKAASGLSARGSTTRASVTLLGSNPTIRANVFGTLSHKVWGRNIPGSGPWLPWVGTAWTPEELHGLGPAITRVVDDFALDEYLDAILDGLAAAFPD